MPRTVLALILIVLPAITTANEAVKSSIVHVYTTSNPYDYSQPWMSEQEAATGSGVIIDGPRVLTNAHVIADHTFIQVRRAGEATKFVADVEAVSHSQDLAILTVADEAFFSGTKPLEIGPLPDPGTSVVTYGFPEGGTRVTITEGVVSRIDHDTYAHSEIPHLVCQIDAAINSGSSGGPVVTDGKIVGLSFQSAEKEENIAYMIPAPIIDQFLTDWEDGALDGPPELPFSYQGMENSALRQSYGMDDTQSGILILDVPELIRGEDKMLPEDILTSIGGFKVANDGTIEFRSGQRVSLDFVHEKMQIGESIKLSLIRKGRPKDVEMVLEFAKTAENYLVPRYLYDMPPQYSVVGGLIFTPFTSNLMDEKIDVMYMGMFRYFADGLEPRSERLSQLVVIADILSDEINSGYELQVMTVIREVNGKPITSMQDVIAAFESEPADGFYRIVLGRPEANPEYIVLSAADVKERDKAILERYRVPAKASPDLAVQASKEVD